MNKYLVELLSMKPPVHVHTVMVYEDDALRALKKIDKEWYDTRLYDKISITEVHGDESIVATA